MFPQFRFLLARVRHQTGSTPLEVVRSPGHVRTLFAVVLAGAVSLMAVGCASKGLPRGARLVGGGLSIKYAAPQDGTVILMERTSRRIVATESRGEGDEFEFRPDYGECNEVLLRMFGPPGADGTPGMGTNIFLELYFVPSR